MNKLSKTILIISITVIGTAFLVVPSTFAQSPDPLVVEFEKTPLFQEANFVPGDGVTRWVKVTNNSGETKKIAIEAINKSDPDNFASKLDLTIKEGATTLFNDTLKNFFDNGETYLSELANSTTTQYDLTITFNSSGGNDYQGKQLGFDILVGFQGTEDTGDGNGNGGGGGGGGGLPPGLTITNETLLDVQQISVTITWLTNYNSTSQIIYGSESESHTLNLNDNAGSPPKYGYARTTPKYDVSPKVTSHLVTIAGLTPGTKYYYRAVSHASLAVSQEYSFTTLGVKEIGEIEEIPLEGISPILPLTTEEVVEKPLVGPGEEEEMVVGEETERPGLVEVEGGASLAGGLLAAVGALPFNLKIILVIFGLILIGLIILWLIGKRKRNLKQN